MGLLEKAGKIQTEEPSPPAEIGAPDTIVLPDPEPVKEKPTKKAKIRKERAKKAKKEKKSRAPKVLPEGFEPATRLRTTARYTVDLIANFGLISFFVAWFIWTNDDITYPLLFSVAVALGNIVYLPSKFARSAGNVITGTQFVNTRGDNPSFLYHLGKSANIPFTFLGLTALMFSISAGTEWTTGTKAFIGISLFLMLIPILDRVMYRMRQDGDIALGFWDRLFGGVWLVTADKTQSDSGIMQRLQSFGEFSESRGWMEESDSNTE